MKRILHIILFCVIIYACNSEFKPITFETIEINASLDAKITVIYDKAIGENELSKTINFKIEEAIINTLSDATKKTSLESILKDFDKAYTNFKKEIPDISDSVWELHIETEKTYQSEDVISIAISTYEFKGGAHGNDKIKFLNLNAKTGSILEQNDIINDIEAFKTIAKSHFVASLEKDEGKIKDYSYGEPFQLPENIGFNDDGLVLLYGVYEVASFNQGYTEFVIPFEELEPLLKVN